MAILLDGTAGITTPDLTDTSLTSGRVVYAGTSGNLTGSTAFTFDGTNLAVTQSGNPTMTVKSTGAGNNPLYRLQADTNYWEMLSVFSDANDTLRFRYNGVDKLTLNRDGTVALAGGDSDATGTGITFPATQNASSNANTLDDYEEGTWTPTLTGAGGTIGSQSYSNQQGFYTKVGRMVTLTGYLQMTNKGSWTGLPRIGGFPFVVASGQPAYSGTGFYNANLTLPAGGSGGGAYPVPGVSYASMFYNTITGTPDSDYSYLNNNTQIGAWTIVYFTN